MPEIIVSILMFVCLIASSVLLFEDPYNRESNNRKYGIYLIVALGILIVWEVIANKYHRTESTEIHNVITVGEDPTNIRQIAILKDKIINVTEYTGRVVDEKECWLKVTKYKTFSYGMIIMYNAEDEYSIVCSDY